MVSLIKQVSITLFIFRSSLARVTKVSNRTKFLSLNDKPCMIKPTAIDFNPI